MHFKNIKQCAFIYQRLGKTEDRALESFRTTSLTSNLTQSQKPNIKDQVRNDLSHFHLMASGFTAVLDSLL